MLFKPYSAFCEGCTYRDVLTLLEGVWNVTCIAQIRIQAERLASGAQTAQYFRDCLVSTFFSRSSPLSILLSCGKQEEMYSVHSSFSNIILSVCKWTAQVKMDISVAKSSVQNWVLWVNTCRQSGTAQLLACLYFLPPSRTGEEGGKTKSKKTHEMT